MSFDSRRQVLVVVTSGSWHFAVESQVIPDEQQGEWKVSAKMLNLKPTRRVTLCLVAVQVLFSFSICIFTCSAVPSCEKKVKLERRRIFGIVRKWRPSVIRGSYTSDFLYLSYRVHFAGAWIKLIGWTWHCSTVHEYVGWSIRHRVYSWWIETLLLVGCFATKIIDRNNNFLHTHAR